MTPRFMQLLKLPLLAGLLAIVFQSLLAVITSNFFLAGSVDFISILFGLLTKNYVHLLWMMILLLLLFPQYKLIGFSQKNIISCVLIVFCSTLIYVLYWFIANNVLLMIMASYRETSAISIVSLMYNGYLLSAVNYLLALIIFMGSYYLTTLVFLKQSIVTSKDYPSFNFSLIKLPIVCYALLVTLMYLLLSIYFNRMVSMFVGHLKSESITDYIVMMLGTIINFTFIYIWAMSKLEPYQQGDIMLNTRLIKAFFITLLLNFILVAICVGLLFVAINETESIISRSTFRMIESFLYDWGNMLALILFALAILLVIYLVKKVKRTGFKWFTALFFIGVLLFLAFIFLGYSIKLYGVVGTLFFIIVLGFWIMHLLVSYGLRKAFAS